MATDTNQLMRARKLPFSFIFLCLRWVELATILRIQSICYTKSLFLMTARNNLEQQRYELVDSSLVLSSESTFQKSCWIEVLVQLPSTVVCIPQRWLIILIPVPDELGHFVEGNALFMPLFPEIRCQ